MIRITLIIFSLLIFISSSAQESFLRLGGVVKRVSFNSPVSDGLFYDKGFYPIGFSLLFSQDRILIGMEVTNGYAEFSSGSWKGSMEEQSLEFNFGYLFPVKDLFWIAPNFSWSQLSLSMEKYAVQNNQVDFLHDNSMQYIRAATNASTLDLFVEIGKDFPRLANSYFSFSGGYRLGIGNYNWSGPGGQFVANVQEPELGSFVLKGKMGIRFDF